MEKPFSFSNALVHVGTSSSLLVHFDIDYWIVDLRAKDPHVRHIYQAFFFLVINELILVRLAQIATIIISATIPLVRLKPNSCLL